MAADGEREWSARVIVRPTGPRGAPLSDAVAVTVRAGESVDVGRGADLGAGLDPDDPGISRVALRVGAADDGWHVTVSNRNGAVLHPWGQQPVWLTQATMPVTLPWPRAAVRLTGTEPERLLHWVLLECDRYAALAASGAGTGITVTLDRPDPLTSAQLHAVRTMFAPNLEWPPVLGPVPLTLDATARRLGVSNAAVYQRLQGAQQRAYQLGAAPQIGVTDPEYVHVLVTHGYLPFPVDHVDAIELELD